LSRSSFRDPVTATRKTSVVLAEELELVREGLVALLDATGRFQTVGRCGDGETALRMVRSLLPDVVLLDLSLPKCHTLELVSRIRTELAAMHIAVMAARQDRKTVLEALRMGANAFVLKSGPVRHLLEALDQASRGGVYMSPEIELDKIFVAANRTLPDDPLTLLSTREYQVFTMLVEGLRPKEIAARLGLSPKTVDTHRASLMKKLGVNDVVSLVKFALRRNLTRTV
jgi:DNA-binding NarL/FixJ family response regulator